VSHNYINLLHLFDTTKKRLYSDDIYQAFLNPDSLGFKDVQERKVIRKANLATFISSVFGSSDVGFFHLNEGFLATLAPDGGRLLKDMGRLYLDLKTQVRTSDVNCLLISGIYFGNGSTVSRSECYFERLVSLHSTIITDVRLAENVSHAIPCRSHAG
jgi:hypothetical protein